MSKPTREVRILPMNFEEEFDEYEDENDVRDTFFGKELLKPRRAHRYRLKSGEYLFRRSGLNATPETIETIVLFQCRSKVIAEAQLIGLKRYLKPRRIDGEHYYGSFCFDVESITVFKPSLELEDIQEFWPYIKFNQTRWRLVPSRNYQAFVRKFRKQRF